MISHNIHRFCPDSKGGDCTRTRITEGPLRLCLLPAPSEIPRVYRFLWLSKERQLIICSHTNFVSSFPISRTIIQFSMSSINFPFQIYMHIYFILCIIITIPFKLYCNGLCPILSQSVLQLLSRT